MLRNAGCTGWGTQMETFDYAVRLQGKEKVAKHIELVFHSA